MIRRVGSRSRRLSSRTDGVSAWTPSLAMTPLPIERARTRRAGACAPARRRSLVTGRYATSSSVFVSVNTGLASGFRNPTSGTL